MNIPGFTILPNVSMWKCHPRLSPSTHSWIPQFTEKVKRGPGLVHAMRSTGPHQPSSCLIPVHAPPGTITISAFWLQSSNDRA